MSGFLIDFGGLPGCGKTTQCKKIEEYLRGALPDREVVITKEPGGTTIAQAIRTLVQGTPFDESMEPWCEAYLFAAARAQSLRRIVLPARARGALVVSDRSVFCSVAFQGGGRELGVEPVWNINATAVGDALPDLFLFLDLDPAICRQRTFDAHGDKFESLDAAFFTRVAAGYRAVGRDPRFRDRYRHIDARGTPEEVFSRILAAIEPYI